MDYLRVLLAASMLGIASYTDITKREVSDYLWIIFAVIAAILIIFEANFFDTLFLILISLIIAPIVLIMWRFGLFGGADAFALIVLAALAPQITLSNNIVSPFTVLTNAVLLSIIPLFINLFRNIIELVNHNNIFDGFDESNPKKVFAMFVGYKAKNPKYCFSIEQKVGEQKKFDLSLQHAEYAEFCNTPNTWVTPGVPYMIFITGGFIIQLFYGDIILKIFGF